VELLPAGGTTPRESPESLIQNHDLRKLVGAAIRDVILLEEQDPDRAQRLASGAVELWMSEAAAADSTLEALSEQSASRFFETDELSFDKQTALDVPTWRSFLSTLAANTGADLPDALRARLAQSLHQKLPRMLLAIVKQDFTGETEAQGRGYASLHLVLLGKTLAGIDQLLQREGLSKEMLEQLRQFNARAPEAVNRHDKRIKDPRERAALSRVLEQIHQLRPHIDRRLDALARAVAAEGVKTRAAVHGVDRKLVYVLTCIAAIVLVSLFTNWLIGGLQSDTRQIQEDTAAIRESSAATQAVLAPIVSQLMAQASARDQQIGSLTAEKAALKSQLEDAVRRLAEAGAAGDASAQQKLEQLRAGGDAKLLRQFLDEEIAKQDKASIELHRELAAVAYVTGEIDIAEKSLQIILAMSPDDLDAINEQGLIYELRGDLPAAEKQYRRLLELDRSDQVRAAALVNLGSIAWTRGDLEGAEKLLRESLEIHRKLGSLEGQAANLGNLGLIARTRGDLEGAEKLHRESLEINRKLGRLEGQAAALGNLGVIAKTRGDLDGAEKLFNESLEIFRKLGRLEGQAAALGNLGVIAKTRGDLDGSEKLHSEALEINRKLGSSEGQAADLANLGVIAEMRGKIPEARELWTQSRDLYAKVGMPQKIKRLQGWLDGLPPG
jgi:tetratricopeptide (TPR) repeat protein